MSNLDHSILFIKDCLIDISNNLIQLHKYKMYENSTIGYTFIFDEIKKIKDLLEQNKNIDEINKKLIDCLKYISLQDIKIVMYILYGYNWFQYLNSDDINKLSVIGSFFNCISVWDSFYHEHSFINVKNSKKRTLNEKTNIIKLIDSNDNNKIILGDFNTFPLFIKSLSDLVLIDKKTNDRKYLFNYNEINQLFKTDSNVLFIKNDNINSLIEDKNGMNVIIRIKGFNSLQDNFLVIQGFFKDDMLEL